MTSRFAIAVSLAFALAACGSSNQPSEQPSATAAVPTETASIAVATPAPEVTAGETPAAAPSAKPTPTPTPKPTPTAKPKPKESASATPVAAASPPDAFKTCAACHSTEPGKTIIGPSLAGVYGRKAGALPGFQYSDAMKSSGLTWNRATLDRYLTDPKSVVPGTTMSFAGYPEADKRKAVIDYLKTL